MMDSTDKIISYFEKKSKETTAVEPVSWSKWFRFFPSKV